MIVELFVFIFQILVTVLVVHVGILLFLNFSNNNKKRKYKKEFKILEGINKSFRSFWTVAGKFFLMLAVMLLSALIGIGLEPVIYKINYPIYSLWGAKVASYIIAIGIYVLLMGNWGREKCKKTN